MKPLLISPSASWVFALHVQAGVDNIPYYDFQAALPSKQTVQLLAFADARAMARATPEIEKTGRRLLRLDVATMRRFGWQPEYALLTRAGSRDPMRVIALREWVNYCCGLLADEANAWLRLFERSPQAFCQFSTHDFTVMLAPYGVTYLLTLSESEGVFIEVIGVAPGGAADKIGADILEIASERVGFTLALLRRKFRERAAVHARAARARPKEL